MADPVAAGETIAQAYAPDLGTNRIWYLGYVEDHTGANIEASDGGYIHVAIGSQTIYSAMSGVVLKEITPTSRVLK